jgi:hypothetical protein
MCVSTAAAVTLLVDTLPIAPALAVVVVSTLAVVADLRVGAAAAWGLVVVALAVLCAGLLSERPPTPGRAA